MRLLLCLLAFACLCFGPRVVVAAGGTDDAADAGRPVVPQPGWPQGLEAFLNDPARGEGWNDWFSEWPSDVHHYAFSVKHTDELNALVEKFSCIKSAALEIHLSPENEPLGLGWVTSLPEGNGIPVLVSIGSQERIEQWFKGLPGGKFGVMEFEEQPVAVPPTMTIYVQNAAVDLAQLKIPQQINVSAGPAPRLFKEAKLKRETATPRDEPELMKGTPEFQKAADRISQFLAARKRTASE